MDGIEQNIYHLLRPLQRPFQLLRPVRLLYSARLSAALWAANEVGGEKHHEIHSDSTGDAFTISCRVPGGKCTESPHTSTSLLSSLPFNSSRASPRRMPTMMIVGALLSYPPPAVTHRQSPLGRRRASAWARDCRPVSPPCRIPCGSSACGAGGGFGVAWHPCHPIQSARGTCACVWSSGVLCVKSKD